MSVKSARYYGNLFDNTMACIWDSMIMTLVPGPAGDNVMVVCTCTCTCTVRVLLLGPSRNWINRPILIPSTPLYLQVASHYQAKQTSHSLGTSLTPIILVELSLGGRLFLSVS
jgi:hypothetical protein